MKIRFKDDYRLIEFTHSSIIIFMYRKRKGTKNERIIDEHLS